MDKEKRIKELEELLEQKKRQQMEVLGVGADDLFVREEIWDIEDELDELKSNEEN